MLRNFEILRCQELAQVNGLAGLVRQLDADGIAARNTATRAETALIERAMSSDNAITRDDLMPGAGSNSYSVTTGPGWTWMTSPLTPKSRMTFSSRPAASSRMSSVRLRSLALGGLGQEPDIRLLVGPVLDGCRVRDRMPPGRWSNFGQIDDRARLLKRFGARSCCKILAGCAIGHGHLLTSLLNWHSCLIRFRISQRSSPELQCHLPHRRLLNGGRHQVIEQER